MVGALIFIIVACIVVAGYVVYDGVRERRRTRTTTYKWVHLGPDEPEPGTPYHYPERKH